MTKRDKLILILMIIVIISAIGSFITRRVFFSERLEDNFHIALAIPMSGPEGRTGLSIHRGAMLFADQFNRSGGLEDKGMVLDIFDDKDNSETVSASAQEMVTKDNIAVIGLGRNKTRDSTQEIYEDNRLPFISLSSMDTDVLKSREWVFGTHYNHERQVRFMANYIRNVLGHKLITIVHDDTPYGEAAKLAFEKTYLRFGTKIRYIRSFSPESDVVNQELAAIVSQIKAHKDSGTLFLATRALNAAKIVKMVRDEHIKNPITGLDTLTTATFLNFLETLPEPTMSVAQYSHGIIAASPLLFDTAGQQTQTFKNAYFKKYGQFPDWIAAKSYEAMQIIAEGLKTDSEKNKEAGRTLSGNRLAIKNYLHSLRSPEALFSGVAGQTRFKSDGTPVKMIQIGQYSGRDLVAAMTQLQPLSQGSPTNYFEEIKKGRMLYVNDRFMYKTNVVYTGIEVEKISELDMKKQTVRLEFALWFRYRGKFDPEDITFPNAAEPVLLPEPEESLTGKDISFKLYRVKGLFFLDFLDTKRVYGDHVLGISFRHKTLDRNNLLYVVDVLGMELNNGGSLLSKIKAAKAMTPVPGWKMSQAWISQEPYFSGTYGKPIYVGYGSLEPEFSRIDLGSIIQEDKFNVKEFIPAEYFVYICIFGVVGMLFAVGIDTRTTGMFWLTSTWFLRCFFWPITLLATGNILLNLSIQHLSNYYTDRLVQGYEMLWWFMAARLAGIALKRFLWDPLETRTEKKIPNVIRFFSSALFYLIALCGVTAFVFGEALTSMLATGGLFTMIIGLAVKSNIANIFSGIVVNIERPFSVGDWIQIKGVPEGEVIDITWRTVRLRTWDKTLVSVTNGQAAESTTINLSRENIRPKVRLQLSPEFDPERICELLQEAVDRVENITKVAPTWIVYLGIKNIYGQNQAVYQIKYWSDDYADSWGIKFDLWSEIWKTFNTHGIHFTQQGEEENETAPLPDPKRAARIEGTT